MNQDIETTLREAAAAVPGTPPALAQRASADWLLD